jgi:hypothetical protein
MIRFAELNDLPRVFELCIMAMDELKDRLPLSLNVEKLSNSILDNWAKAPCFVLEKNGQIEGFYGLTVYVPFYSTEATLGDYMLYLTPSNRTYKNLSGLSKAARDFANERKMPLDLNFITQAKQDTKARFLEKMGAEIIGVKAVYRGQ